MRLIAGNRAVIRGTVFSGQEVTMLVDTGADCTVVDDRTARRIGARLRDRTVHYAALGKTEKAPLALVEELRAGSITTSLACIVHRIPTPGVDIILGLNVLNKHDFSLDYERSRMVFHPAEDPGPAIAFEPESSLILVPLQIRGKTIRALVDTGAAYHIITEGSPVLGPMDFRGTSALVAHLGGHASARGVTLGRFGIGSSEWDNFKAMAVSGVQLPWDVVLSVGNLGLKQVRFHFKSRRLTWTR